MADIEYGEAVDGVPPLSGVNVTGMMNWLGALVSVALISGLVYWGYQLMVRDVSGVPVVRALEGPMRVAPADPGGTSVDYQGLAVNNIAAVGEAEAPADRLVLAPKPTVLTPEDQTAGDLQALQVEESVVAPVETDLNIAPEVVTDVQSLTNTAEEEELPAADQATMIAAALQEASSQAAVPQPELQSVPETIAATIAGVSRSLRPTLRPVLPEGVQLASLQVTPDVLPDASSEVATVDPDTIPVGTRLAQLGAYESVEIAESQWLKISSQFDEFMVDKSRVIQKAQSGGKVFYRLRAHGFDDLSDARRFCSALLAEQANCIPVVTR